jgi:acetyltransferase
MWKYTYNLRGIYETPSLAPEDGDADFVRLRSRESVEGLISKVRKSGRTLLDEVESKELLQSYQIPTVPTTVATSADEAVTQAKRYGYPVVLKLFSRTITHKTDVGGVKLNLIEDAAVRAAFEQVRENVKKHTGSSAGFEGVTVQPMIRLKDAYELIVGASVDPQFGPVMLFGAGGQLVEVMRDRALALPPLNHTLARRLMEQTRIHKALQGVRGRPPCDLDALAHLLVNFSRLIVEQPWIAELDINPLVINHERMLALDARVVLHEGVSDASQLPRPAIRPYPTQYVKHHALSDGTQVTVRPIRPEDEPLMIRFHEGLSEQTVRFRYFHPIKFAQRVAHDRLIRVCFNDYDRELALVAERRDEKSGQREILAIGRLSKTPGGDAGEYAVLVTDAWQRRGLGTILLGSILDIARAEGLRRVFAEILPDNREMIRLSEKLGLTIRRSMESPDVHAEMALSP